MVTRSRVLIENVTPIVDFGEYYTKRVVNDLFQVEVDLVADGHDKLNGCLKIKKQGRRNWQEIPLSFLDNDRWQASIELAEPGIYEYTIEAWVDQQATWQDNIRAKAASKTRHIW